MFLKTKSPPESGGLLENPHLRWLLRASPSREPMAGMAVVVNMMARDEHENLL